MVVEALPMAVTPIDVCVHTEGVIPERLHFGRRLHEGLDKGLFCTSPLLVPSLVGLFLLL
jgi:hypothetical protein